MPSATEAIKKLLNDRVAFYNTPAFVAGDPVSIPHLFTRKEDIEIAGFFAAVLAWGQRTTIIRNCRRLMEWMDFVPHQFILSHQPEDLKPMLGFVHRTFNATDLLFFIHFLQLHYQEQDSLESAFFTAGTMTAEEPVAAALIHFHNTVFSLPEAPARTRKHISTPARGSACKRLCMYLRWMVRQDQHGVDFGIWNAISPAQLVCPLDVHVARVAFRLGLIPDDKSNWRNALLLTEQLRQLDSQDPARYDFALFSLGAEERL